MFIPVLGEINFEEYKLISTLMRNKFKQDALLSRVWNRLALILQTNTMHYTWGAITPVDFMSHTPRGRSAKKDGVEFKGKLSKLQTLTGGVSEHRDDIIAMQGFGLKDDIIDGGSTAFFATLEGMLVELMYNRPGFFDILDPYTDTLSDDGEPYFSDVGDVDNEYAGSGVASSTAIVNDFFGALGKILRTKIPGKKRMFYSNIGNPLELDIIIVAPMAILKVLSEAVLADLLPAYAVGAATNATVRNVVAGMKPDLNMVALADDIDVDDWAIFISNSNSKSRAAHPFALAFNNSNEFAVDRSMSKVNGIEVGVGNYGSLLKVEFLDPGSSVYINDALWDVVFRTRVSPICAVRQRGIRIRN